MDYLKRRNSQQENMAKNLNGLLSLKRKPFLKVLQGVAKSPNIHCAHTAQHSIIPKCQMHHGEGVNTREMLIPNKVFTLAGGFTHDHLFRFQILLLFKKELKKSTNTFGYELL